MEARRPKHRERDRKLMATSHDERGAYIASLAETLGSREDTELPGPAITMPSGGHLLVYRLRPDSG